MHSRQAMKGLMQSTEAAMWEASYYHIWTYNPRFYSLGRHVGGELLPYIDVSCLTLDSTP